MREDAKLLKAAKALAAHVDGIDWDAAAVQADVDAILRVVKLASPSGRADALEVLVQRLRRARLDDADGVAHAAISAGTLVEYGAPPEPLADVLLSKLPAVLAAARRFADACLADLPPRRDDDEDDHSANALLYVDHRAVPADVFRAHLSADRPGACALHRLNEWVLPAIASLTRSRTGLLRAHADGELRRLASALRDSDAMWLDTLLGVEIDARWLVLFPLVGRGFHLAIDGVATNFELHTLVAAALIARGIAGRRPPRQLVAFLEGTAPTAGVPYVEGVWNYYGWRAAAHDLGAPRDVPHEHWVWNEGKPRDVPVFEGTRTLLVGPPALSRTWNATRAFSALPAKVSVVAELAGGEVTELLARMKEAALR